MRGRGVPFFSVVIPVGRKDGESTMREVIRKSGADMEQTELIFVHGTGTAGEKRNRGIQKARGEYLSFLDDDVELPINYFAILRQILEEKKVDVCGGPNISPPGNAWQQVVEWAFSSRVGFGKGARRFQKVSSAGEGDEDCLTGCNLCIRRQAVLEVGSFTPELITGEEVDLIRRLRQKGCSMWYDPKLTLLHHRRDCPSSLWRQIFAYGRGRAVLIRRNGLLLRDVTYLTPSLLVLYTCISVISLIVGVCFASPWISAIACLIPVYATIIMVLCMTRKGASLQARTRLFVVFLEMHYAYGLGMISGFVSAKEEKYARGFQG